MKRRLLLFFSYIGTNYRGLQRVLSNSKDPVVRKAPDFESVQGILEFGLQKVLWVDHLPIFVSSRTDSKVHALETTAQFDLTEKVLESSKRPYSPELICQSLNLFLQKNECDIRVKRIVEVPADFNCRKASSRVYEFRIAVFNQAPHNISSFRHSSAAVDIRELNRCEVLHPPFNAEAVQDACKLFLGRWDFSTFMKSSREVIPPEKRWKTIKRFTLSQETIPDRDSDLFSVGRGKPYDIYTFTIEGSGFLRRQVRRMVGALIGVGSGKVGAPEILWMLKNPKEQNYLQQISSAGPNGLYLRKINYADLPVLRGYLS